MAPFIDWLLGLLTPAQWEAWRAWLTTMGGVTALVIAARTYALNSRSKREEQARKIYPRVVQIEKGVVGSALDMQDPHPEIAIAETDLYGRTIYTAKVSWQRYEITITNESDEPVGPMYSATLVLVAKDSPLVLRWATRPPHYAYAGTIGIHEVVLPKESVTSRFYVTETHSPTAVLIVFRDSAGKWWRREGTEPIRAARDPGRLLPNLWAKTFPSRPLTLHRRWTFGTWTPVARLRYWFRPTL